VSPASLENNIWKLQVIQASRWFMLIMPVLVLFYQDNGLSLSEVFIVQAFFSFCVIVFEVPSGYFADRVGRRRSMIIGVACAAIGFSTYAFAYSLSTFLLAEMLLALGASFISGSDSAMLYDTLLQLKRQEEYQKQAGRLASVANFSEGIAGLAGGALALYSLRLPLYCQAFVLLATLPLVWSLVEPPRKMAARNESGIIAILRIVRYALHGHTEIKWLILYSSLVGTSTLTIVWLVQPYLVSIGWPLALFGLAWAVLQFSVGIFAINAYRIENYLGRRASLISLILFSAGAYVLLGLFHTVWAVLFLFVFYFVRGVNGPVLNDYINRCVESDIRATVLSVKSLVGRLMFVMLGPVVGVISDTYSLTTAFLFCGAVFFGLGVVFLFFLQRNKVL
jgi:MFS family permease